MPGRSNQLLTTRPPLGIDPVPFRLLPNESRGLLDNIYVDADLRLARGNKGTVFVLRKEEGADLPPPEPLPLLRK